MTAPASRLDVWLRFVTRLLWWLAALPLVWQAYHLLGAWVHSATDPLAGVR